MRRVKVCIIIIIIYQNLYIVLFLFPSYIYRRNEDNVCTCLIANLFLCGCLVLSAAKIRFLVLLLVLRPKVSDDFIDLLLVLQRRRACSTTVSVFTVLQTRNA